MSQDIISTKYYDLEIQNIRGVVQDYDDKYPFLLMPVRLETRYMRVDRPVFTEEDPDVLYLVQEMKYLFLKAEQLEITDHRKLKRIKKQILDLSDEIEEKMKSVISLPYPEYEWWKENVEDIRKSYERLLSQLRNSSRGHRGLFEEVERELDEVVTKLEQYKIKKAREKEHDETKTLIKKLNHLEDVFKQMADKPANYTSKTKHHYFNYIETHIGKAEDIFKEVEELTLKNLRANTTQIRRVSEFRAKYGGVLRSVKNRMLNIPSEYKKNEFITKHDTVLLPGTQKLSSMIDEVILPKLNYVKELKLIRASELLYLARMIKFELELINQKGFQSYDQLKHTREHLYDMLRKFRDRGHDIISGTPETVNRLKSTWSEVDGLLEEYTRKVSKLKPTNVYEERGISRSISHINENYRADLAGLKADAPPDRDFIKNSHFIESANAYTLLVKKLETITEHFKNLANTDVLRKRALTIALNKLQDFKGEFEELVTKTTIIPEKFYKNLHNKLQELNNYLVQLENKAGHDTGLVSVVMEMLETANAINKAAAKLESDITDEYDAFYDDFRKKFIFEMPTETVDELWVRIYPDDIAVNSHETAITGDELRDTQYFWTEVWNAAGDEEVELAAWRPLALKYGENRAVYLRELLTPSSRSRRKAKPGRPAVEIKYNLNKSNEILDKLLETTITNRTQDTLFESLYLSVQKCVTLASPLTEETNDMLRIVTELYNQTGEKFNALKEKLERENDIMKEMPTIAELYFNNSVKQFGLLGKKLFEIKAVKDIFQLRATVIPEFPDDYELKESSWSQAPRSDVMPDRFVFMGMKNNEFTHIKVGKTIPDPLIVGIDPSSTEEGMFEYDEAGNLLMNKDIQWLTDFNEAVEKGMGIIVPLRPAEKNDGFDKIIVLGTKHKGAEESKMLLEELLRSHSYLPDGIGILPIGTPTNNTEKKKSGFSTEENVDDTYRRITGEPFFTSSSYGNEKNMDGYRIVEALGIDDAIFNKVKHADGKDIYNALLMNKSMWNSTMGYYMEEILDTVFNLDNIRRTQQYFTSFVSGRGWLPALRIGTQPYGILPTSAFSRFRTFHNEYLPPLKGSDLASHHSAQLENTLQKRFDIRLRQFLDIIRHHWMDIVKRERLKIDDFNPAETTAQQHFIQLLGLQATSIEQYYRYNTNTAQRRSISPSIGPEFTVNFSKDSMYGPSNMRVLFSQLLDYGLFIDDSYYSMNNIDRIKEARIFRLRYHNEFGQLSGPFVRENENDFLFNDDGLSYIDQLLSLAPNKFWEPDIFGDLKSNSLFFLFLRQAMALAYRDVSFDILMNEYVINENTRRRAGSKGSYLIPGPTGEDILFTKWDYLFRNLKDMEDMMKKDVRAFEHFPLAGEGCWNRSDLWKSVSANNWSMADFLFRLPEDDLKVSKIKALKNHFLELKELPVNDLERLFAEHLDLCTYRFDAWQLGLANKRLDKMRDGDGSEGIYLGAFGLLEDLKPGGERKPAVDIPEQLKEKDNKLVYTDEDNEGFIHSPSINHALTAAILRSGYITSRDTGDLNNVMAVNLTSKRVRMALRLIEGIQNGQETGALLGYQFERGLHENYLSQGLELDRFIYDLRRKFPLVPDVDSETEINTNEEKNLMHVVNGLELLESVRSFLGDEALRSADSLFELEKSNRTQLRAHLGLNGHMSTNQLNAIFKEIDEMANAFDAMGDLLLSESVYHITQGNHVRSAAVFAALSEGKVPPDVQIINTPRTGHVLTQRVMLQLETISASNLETNTAPARAQYWENINLTPRSFAEPSLNKWIGEMLGDPSQIRCYVTYELGAEQSYIIRLSDLGLQAIDIVYLLNTTGIDGDGILNKLIAFHVRKSLGLPVDTTINIHFKERNDKLVSASETLTYQIKTFNEMMPLFNALYETITQSRPTTAEDYVIPGENIPADMNMQQQDVEELRSRTEKAYAGFSAIMNDIQSLFDNKGINMSDPQEVKNADYSGTEIDTLRMKLLDASGFGLHGTIPDTAIEVDSETGRALAVQAVGVLKEMKKRVSEATLLLSDDGRQTDYSKIEGMKEAAKVMFGNDFIVVPHFSLRNAEEINDILGLDKEEGLLRNADESDLDGWVESITKVRKKVNKLEMVSAMAGLFDNEFPEYTPVQLPYETVKTTDGTEIADYWLGLEYPPDYEPESDKLSMVILNKEQLGSLEHGVKSCGLLIDEWIEIIPQKEETTGITFNYDQPDAEPPQSLLLAVPPEETGKWEWDDLVYTILDTMDLYKTRLIEPEQIDKSIFTQVLPGVLGEYPVKNEYRDEMAKMGMFDLAENNKGNND